MPVRGDFAAGATGDAELLHVELGACALRTFLVRWGGLHICRERKAARGLGPYPRAVRVMRWQTVQYSCRALLRYVGARLSVC
eukprot:6935276-Prymnesium_polylepis.1